MVIFKGLQCLLSVVSILFCICLDATTLPLFFRWDSSYAAQFKPGTFTEKDSEYSKYIVTAGIDTTWADKIHTRLEVTNEQSKLNTQILLKSASVNYHHNWSDIRLSLEARGYGNSSSFYNRRVESPLWGKNKLLDYHWQGIMVTHQEWLDNFIYAGLGDNQLNGIMYNLGYRYSGEHLKTNAFLYRAQRDDRYNTPVYHYGTTFAYETNSCVIQQGFVYNSLPRYDDFPSAETNRKLLGWKAQTDVGIFPWSSWEFAASAYFRRPDDNQNVIEQTLNALVCYSWGKIWLAAEVTDEQKVAVSGETYSLDVGYVPLLALKSQLEFMGYVDYINVRASKPVYKVGLQTSYSFDGNHSHNSLRALP